MEIYLGHYFYVLWPRNIIDRVTIRFAICHFLLMVLWNRASTSTRFLDVRSQNLKHRQVPKVGLFYILPMQYTALDRQ